MVGDDGCSGGAGVRLGDRVTDTVAVQTDGDDDVDETAGGDAVDDVEAAGHREPVAASMGIIGGLATAGIARLRESAKKYW